MNYNLAFFTNDYTLIDNSQNLINKQLEFFTNLSTRNIARNFIANVVKYKNGNLMYNRFKTQYDFPETTDYNYYNLIFSDSSSNTIQNNWLNDSANDSKINDFINKSRDLLNGVIINEPLYTEYFKILRNQILIHRTQNQVRISLPSSKYFSGTYYTTNNYTGVHSIVTLTFASNVKDLVDNYANINIGPYNTTLTQPPINGFEYIVKIGENITPGNIVLEEDNDYLLFSEGATNIPAIIDVKFTTIEDNDMTKLDTNKIAIRNGIEIINSTRQVYIILPDENDFLGTYNTSNGYIGINSIITITFASNVTDLINNYGKTNIGPFQTYLSQSATEGFENIITIGENINTGDIVLEKNNTYTLFEEGAYNIPPILNVEMSTTLDGNININNHDKLAITNNNI